MYSARHALLLLKQHDWAGAIAVLATHGVNTNPANFQLYRDVVLEVLAVDMHHRQQQAELQCRYELQHVLGCILSRWTIPCKVVSMAGEFSQITTGHVLSPPVWHFSAMLQGFTLILLAVPVC